MLDLLVVPCKRDVAERRRAAGPQAPLAGDRIGAWVLRSVDAEVSPGVSRGFVSRGGEQQSDAIPPCCAAS